MHSQSLMRREDYLIMAFLVFIFTSRIGFGKWGWIALDLFSRAHTFLTIRHDKCCDPKILLYTLCFLVQNLAFCWESRTFVLIVLNIFFI